MRGRGAIRLVDCPLFRNVALGLLASLIPPVLNAKEAHAQEYRLTHSLDLFIHERAPYDSLRGLVATVNSAHAGAGAIADGFVVDSRLGRWFEVGVISLFDGFVSCVGHEFSHASIFPKTGNFFLPPSTLCPAPQVNIPMIEGNEDLELFREGFGAGYNFHALAADKTLDNSLQGGDVHDALSFLISRFSQTGYTIAAFTQHGLLRSTPPKQNLADVVNGRIWDLEAYAMMMNVGVNGSSTRRVKNVNANEIAGRQLLAEIFTLESYHTFYTVVHYGATGKKEYLPWMVHLGDFQFSSPVFNLFLTGKGPIVLGSEYGLWDGTPFKFTYGNDRTLLRDDSSSVHYLAVRMLDLMPHSLFDVEVGGALTFWEREKRGYSVTIGGMVPFAVSGLRVGSTIVVQQRDILERDVHRNYGTIGYGIVSFDL